MREPVTDQKLYLFLEVFGKKLRESGRVYLTGGSTALLKKWRNTTLDIDLSAKPEPKNFFESIAEIKNELQINIELASPNDFVPELEGWENRSEFIGRYGNTDFYHFDYYSQAFSKLSRGHVRDLKDVEEMHAAGFIQPTRFLELFVQAQSKIIKYPALSAEKLKETIHNWCSSHDSNPR